MVFILNMNNFLMFWMGKVVSYTIEIKLPTSGIWFKYFTGIDTFEEAKLIKQAAERMVKVRILKNN